MEVDHVWVMLWRLFQIWAPQSYGGVCAADDRGGP